MQLALAKLISAIFEPHLSDTMYGFRPKRNCHDAIRNLTGTIQMKKVNYIVDADIKGFFDNVDHEWLIECIKQRIIDMKVKDIKKSRVREICMHCSVRSDKRRIRRNER